MDFVDKIFSDIQYIWCRLHDFILMHIITDMGYTEMMMQSIVNLEQKTKSKHVDFLRKAFFAQEEEFVLEKSPMFLEL